VARALPAGTVYDFQTMPLRAPPDAQDDHTDVDRDLKDAWYLTLTAPGAYLQEL
jgi:hypothetical protein